VEDGPGCDEGEERWGGPCEELGRFEQEESGGGGQAGEEGRSKKEDEESFCAEPFQEGEAKDPEEKKVKDKVE
jgi:hypothetical protein